MVEHHIGDIAVGALVAILSWFTKVLHGDVRAHEKELAYLKEDLGKNYLRKDEYRQDMTEVKAKLDKIIDKIDTKEDKH